MTRAFGFIVAGLAVASALAIGPAVAHAATRDSNLGPVFYSPRDIEDAQTILVQNHDLPAGSYAPGELDAPTLRAIRAFQRYHALRASGQLDPSTMGMLMSHQLTVAVAAAPPAPRGNVELSERQAAQAPEEKAELTARTTNEPAGMHRTMPATGGPIALVTAIGGALAGFGIALLCLLRRI